MPGASETISARASDSGSKHERGCLFCLRTDGGFRSREHIFSEALGNHEYVLPPGVVCDRCNSGPLSRADAALIDFPPITLMRAERGLRTKTGKQVVSTWSGVDVAFPRPGEMVLGGHAHRTAVIAAEGDVGTANGGGLKLRLETGGPVATHRLRKITQSAWKSALEFIYLQHGDGAFDRVFDPVRTAVLKTAVSGWAMLALRSEPHGALRLNAVVTTDRGCPGMPVHMDIFGVRIYTDPLQRGHEKVDFPRAPGVSVWRF